MVGFKATAYNEKGYTFAFFFKTFNWNGIEETAKAALDKIVANDPLHQKFGPWFVRGIDRG